MNRKSLIQTVISQINHDKAFENEALATYVEDKVAEKLTGILSEGDIQHMESLGNESENDKKIYEFLVQKAPNLNNLIQEEIMAARAKFGITK